MVHRFRLSHKQAAAITGGKAAADQTLARLFRLGSASNSRLYHLLNPLGTEYLLYLMAKARPEAAKKAISLYFTQLKRLKPELSGRDLVAMGYAPGPLIKEMLEQLLEARLNGEVKNRDEEREFIRKRFGRAAKALA